MQIAKKIIIIGGGIGGTATAVALHRVGFEPIVYERTATLQEVGAGIALWANATRILQELGLLEDVLRESDVITNYQFFSQTGEELMNLQVDDHEVPAVAIHRADLQTLLCRQLPSEQFVLGQEFERFEIVGEKVHAYFANGLLATGDALIGADGLRSKVRCQLRRAAPTQLFGEAQPTYHGMTSYRGLTNYIPSSYKQGYIYEFLGAGKAFGFVSIGKGRMYWYVASPAPEGQPDKSIGRKRELEEMFHNWPAPIPELIAATDEANIIKTDLYDRPPIPKWSQQNVTLLGDAAHPTLPTMGQGACMAIEDALAVTQCLLKHSEPTDAFGEYELIRLLRTKKIVEQSLLIGKVARLQNPLVAAMRNTFMKLLSHQFEKDYKTLHVYKVTVD